MKAKLTTKDLITAGAFGAIYLVLLTVLSSVLTIVPILFLATPLIAGIILGTVYMLYATKVPRTGAILVLAILVGLITSMATIYPLIFAVVWGLIAELITAKRRKSAGALAVSYCVFNLTSMGPFFALVLAKDAFLGKMCRVYYGEEYIATLDKLTPSWIVLVLIALALVGGLLGGLFGRKILKKHFVKAGITA